MNLWKFVQIGIHILRQVARVKLVDNFISEIKFTSKYIGLETLTRGITCILAHVYTFELITMFGTLTTDKLIC